MTIHESDHATGKLPLTAIAGMARRGEKLVMVTAYDAPSARLADAAGVDIVLVGDSAGTTMLGYDSTGEPLTASYYSQFASGYPRRHAEVSEKVRRVGVGRGPGPGHAVDGDAMNEAC